MSQNPKKKKKSHCMRLDMLATGWKSPASNTGKVSTTPSTGIPLSVKEIRGTVKSTQQPMTSSYWNSPRVPCTGYAHPSKYIKKTSIKRTSGTHDKPHILEKRSAFFECAFTLPNYRVRNYKFHKNFIQVFYTNFEEP